MLQIALVPHQHDHNVGIRVITQLFEPAVDVLVGGLFGDVVDEEGADCSSVVAVQRGGRVSARCGRGCWEGGGAYADVMAL